ncbi:hypothetical protein [Alkalihalobacterium alkalinitrilicum]|nr:hypothetical protein [Alkalihalobacterium alkalinitrilicum]
MAFIENKKLHPELIFEVGVRGGLETAKLFKEKHILNVNIEKHSV